MVLVVVVTVVTVVAGGKESNPSPTWTTSTSALRVAASRARARQNQCRCQPRQTAAKPLKGHVCSSKASALGERFPTLHLVRKFKPPQSAKYRVKQGLVLVQLRSSSRAYPCVSRVYTHCAAAGARWRRGSYMPKYSLPMPKKPDAGMS